MLYEHCGFFVVSRGFTNHSDIPTYRQKAFRQNKSFHVLDRTPSLRRSRNKTENPLATRTSTAWAGIYWLTLAASIGVYVYRFADKHETLALGVYPTTLPAKARPQRDEIHQLLVCSADPGTTKKANKASNGAEAEFEAANAVSSARKTTLAWFCFAGTTAR